MIKFFRVRISKVKGYHYIRLPKIIVDRMNLSAGDEIEISICRDKTDSQTALWEQSPGGIRKIRFTIPDDTLTMNMYGRLYIPSEYRFFFPPSLRDFILETNVGNIQTHINSEGNIIKGLKPWFMVNHPIEVNDMFTFEKLDNRPVQYRMIFEKGKT